jgi:hypothetical protein
VIAVSPSYVVAANELAEDLDAVVESMETCGYGAGLAVVEDWETKVSELLEETAEVVMPRIQGRLVKGLDRRWTFQGHWGRGLRRMRCGDGW